MVAGVGSNDTHQTIKLQNRLPVGRRRRSGDYALLQQATQAGLIAHFEAVSDSVPDTPIMLYNVPGRTGVSL